MALLSLLCGALKVFSTRKHLKQTRDSSLIVMLLKNNPELENTSFLSFSFAFRRSPSLCW